MGDDFHQDCHECINENPGYRCKCNNGFREDNSTNKGNCIDINECEVGEEGYDSDCHNCNNTKGSHTCSCNRGYKLSSNGKSCIDVNECDGVNGTDYNQDCHHCQNAEPGYTCECNDGYEADNSNLEGTCVDIDECLGDEGVAIDKDCHTCENTQGSYTCECDEGYERHPNEKRCIDVDECERELYDVGCHTCVNLIGGHTCLCNDTFTLDNNSNNETCVDPSQQSTALSLTGIIIGAVAILFLIAAVVAVVCFIKKRWKTKCTIRIENIVCVNIKRKNEKKAYVSPKALDADKMETNEYEELRDIPRGTNESSTSHPEQKSVEVTSIGGVWNAVLSFFQGKGRNEEQTNKSPKHSDVNAPDVEVLEENEYDEIRDISIDFSHSAAANKQTSDATYYSTPGNHFTTLDNSIEAEYSDVSQAEETRQEKASGKTAKPMLNTKSDGKLEFVQVDGSLGEWSFFAFKCPKGRDAVRQFWRLVEDREIQNVVLLEDVSSKVLPAAGGSTCNGIKVFCKEEWQNKGIKKFTVTFNIEKLSKKAEYVKQHKGISVLTLDHELTNKAIISLRQNLIPNGRSQKCAIMCNDGQQLSGFFIGVNCMLDMVDKGNKINCMHGLNKFKTVCPEFEPSEEQLLQLSQLSKDYISHGKKSK